LLFTGVNQDGNTRIWQWRGTIGGTPVHGAPNTWLDGSKEVGVPMARW